MADRTDTERDDASGRIAVLGMVLVLVVAAVGITLFTG